MRVSVRTTTRLGFQTDQFSEFSNRVLEPFSPV